LDEGFNYIETLVCMIGTNILDSSFHVDTQRCPHAKIFVILKAFCTKQ